MRHIYMNDLYEQEEDAALVTQTLAGNRGAFSALVSRYGASVQRLCIRLLGDPVEAQDVAQEAILQAFLGLSRLQQPDRFGAWLHAIAANIARSALRRQRPVSFEGLEFAGSLGLQRAMLFPSLEQILDMRETHDAIVEALRDLSIVNREAVVGYHFQDYSYAELADLLGVPISTVKSRLFKGRQQLRQRLEHLRQPVQINKESPMTLELIPLQIEMICEFALTQRSILVLRTREGERYLSIKLLSQEAVVLERALKSQPDVLPVTHSDTLVQLVSKLGGRMEQVIVRSLAKQNYYASLVVAQNGQHSEIDCRLSEALVLAVRAQIPILSAPILLEEAGITLETIDTDPAVTEAELPEPLEPVTVSDQWRETFIERVWSLLLSVAPGYRGNRTPYDLSRLREFAWSEIFPAQEANWEGQTMQVVRLPAAEPAWLVIRPNLWGQINDFVEWVQQRGTQQPTEPQPRFIPPTEEQEMQVEELLEGAWPALIDLGARTLALMHLSGRLISWKSLDSYEAAVRMGRAAVKDLVLTWHFNALLDATAEPAIRITYERSTGFNPAQAAGINVVSSSEVLIHNAWLLVVGWASDGQQQGEQHQVMRVQKNLEALLPA